MIVKINSIIVILTITIGLFILFTQNIEFNPVKSSSSELRIISFATDKQDYHSNEKMNIILEIYASNDVENVDVKVFGIKDRKGNYRLNNDEKRNLTSGTNSITFSYTTPSCYGCAGINPGLHEITSLVSYNDIVTNTSVEIEIKS